MPEKTSGKIHENIENIFSAGGEMGARMRATDWTKTPPGAAESGSQAPRPTAGNCLNSPFTMVIWRGRELVLLYRDSRRSILAADKDKIALGNRAEVVWGKIWDVVPGPMFVPALNIDEATWKDIRRLVNRFGFTEKAYFTWSDSPIRGNGEGVGRVFTAVTEATQRVVGERRLKTLRDPCERPLAQARSVEKACRLASAQLAENPFDIPSVLIYLMDDGKTARLSEAVWHDPNAESAAPEIVAGSDVDVWNFGFVLETKRGERIENLSGKFGKLPAGAWADEKAKQLATNSNSSLLEMKVIDQRFDNPEHKGGYFYEQQIRGSSDQTSRTHTQGNTAHLRLLQFPRRTKQGADALLQRRN